MNPLTYRLPEGTILFHGSNEPLDLAPNKTPTWFSQGRGVAEYFSTWYGRTPHSKIHTFVTAGPLRLLRIDTRPQLDALLEDLGHDPVRTLGGEDDYAGILDLFQDTRTDGWIIPSHYKDGDDICIGNLSEIQRKP